MSLSELGQTRRKILRGIASSRLRGEREEMSVSEVKWLECPSKRD